MIHPIIKTLIHFVFITKKIDFFVAFKQSLSSLNYFAVELPKQKMILITINCNNN